MGYTRKFQNSFSSGELTPGVLARTDLEKYAAGCKRLINGIVHPYGGVSVRPGTLLVDELPGEGILIPFSYSIQQAYVLCFYNTGVSGAKAKMRIYRTDSAGEPGYVAQGGNPLEVETPYVPGDLDNIKFTQSADVLFLAHPDYSPRKLVRHSDTSWEFSQVSFIPDIQPPTGLTATASGFNDPSGTYVATTEQYKVASVDSQEIESPPSDAVTANTLSTWPTGARVKLAWNAVPGASYYMVYKNKRGYYTFIGTAEGTSFTDDNIEGDDGTGPKENRDPFNPAAVPTGGTITPSVLGGGTIWMCAASVTSSGVVSLPGSTVCATGAVPNVTFTCDIPANAASCRFYWKTADSAWKWEEATRATSSATTVSVTPGTTSGQEGAPLSKIVSYPGAVGIFQQRLIYGRTDQEPHTVWMSETGAFDSMAVATPLRDDSAITATADSTKMSEIRHFIPLREMMMLSSSAEFKVGSTSSGGAVTPTSISFTVQSYWGSSAVPPIASGTTVLFIENSGRVVRDMYYKLEEDGYSGNDVSLLAEHLLTCPVHDWAYQQDPFSTVYICLEDGKLLTMTYMREQNIVAWAQHESADAAFISVSCIRERDDDNVYFLVRRGTSTNYHYYIEFQMRRDFGDDIKEAFFVDCGLQYHDPSDPITNVTGLSHLAGKSVAVLADGSVIPGMVVSAGGTITLPHAAGIVTVGLPYAMTIETLDPDVKTEFGVSMALKKNIVRVSLMLRETRDIFVGPDEDNLVQVKLPISYTCAQPPDLYTGRISLTIPGSHREETTIVIRHSTPLPITVLGLVTEVSLG